MGELKPRADVYRTFWRFASVRHSVFEQRISGVLGPWSSDPIIGQHRFTNPFRAADRVSQHLIRNAAYGMENASSRDLFLRIAFHRLFSRPSTWDLIESEHGEISVRNFAPDLWAATLDRAQDRGERLYTGAFILCASDHYGHRRKHQNHLALLQDMLDRDVPDRVTSAESLQAVYRELLSLPMIGRFMAYQIAIDLNYSDLIDFDEDEFTVPGPGAERGLRKLFPNLHRKGMSEAIRWLTDQQGTVERELGIRPPSLFGRKLHLIDVQNLLCETDKYCRQAFPDIVSERSRIKQRYRPTAEPLRLFFPPKWGLQEASESQ